MHPDPRLRRAVVGFYAYIGAVIMAGVGPAVGTWLVHHDAPPWRAAGVVVGIATWLPLMFFTAWRIRGSDEFLQRIHLLALSLAFAAGLLLVSTLDWLVRAGFIEPVPYM